LITFFIDIFFNFFLILIRWVNTRITITNQTFQLLLIHYPVIRMNLFSTRSITYIYFFFSTYFKTIIAYVFSAYNSGPQSYVWHKLTFGFRHGKQTKRTPSLPCIVHVILEKKILRFHEMIPLRVRLILAHDTKRILSYFQKKII